jgi:hypothetical protein
VLFNPSSTDLFVNTERLMAVAKLFYATGISWTLSSKITETANFGFFFHEHTMREHSRRLVRADYELGVKRLVASECGHGWRTWRILTGQRSTRMSFLKERRSGVERPSDFTLPKMSKGVAQMAGKSYLKATDGLSVKEGLSAINLIAYGG